MSNIYDLTMTAIDGREQSLSEYKGKVMLVVNVASKCGLTPQYEQLEALYEKSAEQGLVVLGFPCNEFAGQEPGSDAEIQSFCQSTFGVKFPMFSKIEVNGDARHALYQQLIAAQPERVTAADSGLEKLLTDKKLISGNSPSDILWNFEKFLVNKEGEIVGRFAPDMTVDATELSSAIDAALAA